jgi:molybdopterin synthase catalytic subunit
MTERELERIVAEAESRWPSITCEVAHRVGSIDPADTLVLVAVWSAHRVAARDACAEILERLKHEAPFWKRERLSDGSERWVERNTPGT